MTLLRNLARVLLGIALIFAGSGHLTFLRQEFQAQVPNWVPLDPDFVVLASGLVEVALGLLLLFAKKYRKQVGWLTAIFFLAIFPGNIAQFLTHTNAFGLNSDLSRGVRLVFQPLLILWALWATRAVNRSSK
jgi:uncharacterized membrane protein